MIGIYRFTNMINGKRYIGKSTDILRRYEGHIYNANNKTDCQLIDKEIKKYGVNSFRFEILEICEEENLNDYETYWIKYYQTNFLSTEYDGYGYNMTDGGNGGKTTTSWSCGHIPWNKGLNKYNDDRVRQYGEKQKGKYVSEDTREKLRYSAKNREHKKMSEERRLRYVGSRNPMYGKPSAVKNMHWYKDPITNKRIYY